MTIYIYIRHAEKVYDNKQGLESRKRYAFDSPIKPNQKDKFKAYAKSLIINYGMPTLLLSSPFLRCRETRNLMIDDVPKNVEQAIDPVLSEYLANQLKNVHALDYHIHPMTLQYGVCFDKHENQFTERCRVHVEHMRNFDGVIWVFTHGFNCSKIKEIWREHAKAIVELNSTDFVVTK